MSQAISPRTNKPYGLKRVCETWDIARCSFYKKACRLKKRGQRPIVTEGALLAKIQEDLKATPFKGEGHRKVHIRLKKQGIKAGRNRILRVMRENRLLSPHRNMYKPPNLHEGRITTDAPNVMWGSDGTKVRTVDDGWVWVFSVAEHWNAECLGWHVCKVGDRVAALEPVSQAIKKIYGSQYTSDYFLQQVSYWGIDLTLTLGPPKKHLNV